MFSVPQAGGKGDSFRVSTKGPKGVVAVGRALSPFPHSRSCLPIIFFPSSASPPVPLLQNPFSPFSRTHLPLPPLSWLLQPPDPEKSLS